MEAHPSLLPAGTRGHKRWEGHGLWTQRDWEKSLLHTLSNDGFTPLKLFLLESINCDQYLICPISRTSVIMDIIPDSSLDFLLLHWPHVPSRTYFTLESSFVPSFLPHPAPNPSANTFSSAIKTYLKAATSHSLSPYPGRLSHCHGSLPNRSSSLSSLPHTLHTLRRVAMVAGSSVYRLICCLTLSALCSATCSSEVSQIYPGFYISSSLDQECLSPRYLLGSLLISCRFPLREDVPASFTPLWHL